MDAAFVLLRQLAYHSWMGFSFIVAWHILLVTIFFTYIQLITLGYALVEAL